MRTDQNKKYFCFCASGHVRFFYATVGLCQLKCLFILQLRYIEHFTLNFLYLNSLPSYTFTLFFLYTLFGGVLSLLYSWNTFINTQLLSKKSKDSDPKEDFVGNFI